MLVAFVGWHFFLKRHNIRASDEPFLVGCAQESFNERMYDVEDLLEELLGIISEPPVSDRRYYQTSASHGWAEQLHGYESMPTFVWLSAA